MSIILLRNWEFDQDIGNIIIVIVRVCDLEDLYGLGILYNYTFYLTHDDPLYFVSMSTASLELG